MRFFLVDAFTDTAFAGNPAGVVILDGPADPTWMQSVAAELKHSETAFVEVPPSGPNPLRWFTPTTEVELCGHATLATAHVLTGARTFTTRSGQLRTWVDNGYVHMDLPADPPEPSAEELAEVLAGFGLEYVGRGCSDVLVEVTDVAQLRGFEPDLAKLARVACRALIVTAASDTPGTDFVSRVFAPRVGVDEDPVTGSAHCTLAPYWAHRLGRSELVAEQASARGGRLQLGLAGDRVDVAGAAVTIAQGELLG